MGYLGLDLSLSSTGFCLLREDGTTKSFEINTDPKKFPCLIKRVRSIADKIVSEIKGEDIKLVLMEDYYVGKFAASVISLSALGTMVREKLLESGYRYVTVKPTSIKKFETGSGAAKKGNMVKEVFKNHKFDTASDNIADACAMAYLCKGYSDYICGRTDYHKYQLEVLKQMSKSAVIEEPY